MIEVRPHPRGAVVLVHAQPAARRNAVLGEHAGALRVAVTAAPERGQANDAIIRVLGELLRVRRSQITLVSGETGRAKRFLVEGLTMDEVRSRIG